MSKDVYTDYYLFFGDDEKDLVDTRVDMGDGKLQPLVILKRTKDAIKRVNPRVDNRIFYTAGQAILDLKLMDEKVKVVYAVPLSSASKNIFFDRG